MKILAILPSFNSGESLPPLLAKIRLYIPEILVVDDGSTDNTTLIARQAGTNLIRFEKNLGKGAALKSGFQYALQNSYEYILTLDSDSQHDPEYIPQFLRCLSETSADLIIGSRRRSNTNMPWDRRLSNSLTSKFLSLMLRMDIEDCQSGFRLISCGLLKGVSLKTNRFELESEMIIKSARAGFKLCFIPLQASYENKSPSSINRLTDTIRWIKMIIENL